MGLLIGQKKVEENDIEKSKFRFCHFDDIERLTIVGDSRWEKVMAKFVKPANYRKAIVEINFCNRSIGRNSRNVSSRCHSDHTDFR